MLGVFVWVEGGGWGVCGGVLGGWCVGGVGGGGVGGGWGWLWLCWCFGLGGGFWGLGGGGEWAGCGFVVGVWCLGGLGGFVPRPSFLCILRGEVHSCVTELVSVYMGI